MPRVYLLIDGELTTSAGITTCATPESAEARAKYLAAAWKGTASKDEDGDWIVNVTTDEGA